MTGYVKRWLLTTFAVVALGLNMFAEKPPIKNFTTSDGLAHDRIYRIVRDSRGFLWFCTGEGLSRFDGLEFKNYTQDDGLPHRAVRDLLETRNGQMWAATGDGIALFDPTGKSARHGTQDVGSDTPMFRAFRDANANVGSRSWSVSDLLEDSRGTIWAAASHGLYRLDLVEGDWRLSRVDTESWGHSSRQLVELLEDRTGALWIGAERGLHRRLPDGQVQVLDPILRIESLLEDRAGRIWAGSGGGESSGLYQFVLVDNALPKLVRVFDARDGLSSSNWMNALMETSDGRLFVGVGNGLSEYAPSAGEKDPQFRIVLRETIVALGEDPAGNLWIGTSTNGARRLSKRGFVAYDETDGLKRKSVSSILNGPNGELYVLSIEPHRFDGKRFVPVSPRGLLVQNWSHNQLSFQDHAGEWWIAGYTGLQRYPKVAHLEDLEHKAHKRIYTTADGLVSNSIFQLFEDSRGDIWISTIEGDAMLVHRWERAADKIHLYQAPDGMPTRNCATAFGEDVDGNVWMGFYEGGLARYRNGTFDIFTAADGLPTGFIEDIHTDRSGRLWIATTSGGVVRIDDPTVERPKLTVLTTADGLTSNQAGCVTEDNFGRIYIGTGRGVTRLDPTTGGIKLFTTSDGLPENFVTLCQRAADGALWFATYSGLARYVPEPDEQAVPPAVFLSEVRVNGQSVKRLSELGEPSVEIPELSSDQRQVQVGFFALGFGTGETLRYQYRLGNGEWSEPSIHRTLNLELSPGTYDFAVRAINSEGVASAEPAKLAFSIARPIWQRWWFLVLAAVAGSLAIYAVYRYRLQRLLELERVRTRIAADLHDDIGASLSKISILSEIAGHRVAEVAPDAGEVTEPLGAIAGTSREMVDSMADIVWAINPAKDRLSDLVQRMRNLAGELTEFNDIRLSVDTSGVGDPDLPLGADMRREIYLIFKETVNNVVKHSDCSAVEIAFTRENDGLVISVKDDGKGFDPSANGSSGTRGGNGLPNMRRRAASLGGTYEVLSEPGKGTLATLRVPLRSRSALNKLFGRYPNG